MTRSRSRTALAAAHVVAVAVGALLALELTASFAWRASPSPASLWIYWLLRSGLLLLVALAIVRGFYIQVVRSPWSERIKQVALCLSAVMLLGLALEVILTFLPRSHGSGYSLASINWMRRYWKPINELGYRDSPRDFSGHDGRQRIFVLGDSFTAGGGIPRAADRFSDVLAEKLSSRYEVANLGWNGSDTTDQYRRLLELPAKPDILVLQYFGNDIEQRARQSGVSWSGVAYGDVIRPLGYLVRNSYLLNLVYWSFPHGDEASYRDFLLTAYQTPAVLEQHLGDLGLFIEHCRRHDIVLLVVVFPYAGDRALSEVYVRSVAGFFTAKSIPVIDVSELASGVPVSEQTVNVNDAHPSVLVHRLVGEKIYQVLAAEGAISER